MEDTEYLPSYQQALIYRGAKVINDYDRDKYNKEGRLYKDVCRELETLYLQDGLILDAVNRALDGDHESISDFERSFPIVRKAMDMWVDNV